LESANLELKKLKSDLKTLQREKQTWVLMQQSGILCLFILDQNTMRELKQQISILENNYIKSQKEIKKTNFVNDITKVGAAPTIHKRTTVRDPLVPVPITSNSSVRPERKVLFCNIYSSCEVISQMKRIVISNKMHFLFYRS
jgi:hypothetical protein